MLVENFDFYVPESSDKFLFKEPDISKKPQSKLQYTAGNQAYENQFPYVCEIRILATNGDGFVCTGSLIGDEWVLSARHCIDG